MKGKLNVRKKTARYLKLVLDREWGLLTDLARWGQKGEMWVFSFDLWIFANKWVQGWNCLFICRLPSVCMYRSTCIHTCSLSFSLSLSRTHTNTHTLLLPSVQHPFELAVEMLTLPLCLLPCPPSLSLALSLCFFQRSHCTVGSGTLLGKPNISSLLFQLFWAEMGLVLGGD